MKGITVLFIGIVVALVAATVSFVPQKIYADDIGYIERLVPAESQPVETGGGETAGAMLVPFPRGNDRIEELLPAESQETETGGGEGAKMFVSPSEVRTHDTSRIHLLLPAND